MQFGFLCQWGIAGLVSPAHAPTTWTLISTARGLLSTVSAMTAPCSVNANGIDRENFNLARWSQFVTTSDFSASVQLWSE